MGSLLSRVTDVMHVGGFYHKIRNFHVLERSVMLVQHLEWTEYL